MARELMAPWLPTIGGRHGDADNQRARPPPASHITGYELVEPLLVLARRRAYLHRTGQPAQVDFVCQGVTEPLRQLDDSPVPDHSADVVNASGVVGHHLNRDTVAPLIAE